MQTEQIKDAVEQVEKNFGRIDILVNNAGLGLFDNAEKTADGIWRQMVDTNLNVSIYLPAKSGK